MHILCLVLVLFCIFFYLRVAPPPLPHPPCPLPCWDKKVLVTRARTDILQFFFPYKQHCCLHSLVCKILIFWSAGFCTVSVTCVVVYWGTCTLPTIKFEGGKLAVGWHSLHFLILKVVRRVVLGVSLIYVPQA